jgi:hypothetical protein
MTDKNSTPAEHLDYPDSREDRRRHARETGADTETLHQVDTAAREPAPDVDCPGDSR